jgi:hypothetical protein
MQKRWATVSKEIGLSKPVMQQAANLGYKIRRIVAPKVAGLNPVGHPPVFRKAKPNTRVTESPRFRRRGLVAAID